jgi:hypothetical protein
MISLLKARARKLTITANDERIEAATRRMRPSLEKWLRSLAEFFAAEAASKLKSGKLRLRKADSSAKLEADLVRILATFGLRDASAAGKDMATRLESDWIVPPDLIERIIRQKKVRVKNIMAKSRQAVRAQLRKLLLDASKERPQPSIAEIQRRIRKTYFGAPGQDPIPLFSRERATLIARSEAVQAENTGIYEGMQVASIDEKEWLAHTDGKSGKRHHERMNGKRVPMNEKFTMPSGKKLRYPGDPSGHISETAR